MSTPPQELVMQLTKLTEIFASLRRNRQHFVGPQQALPNLELAHQCCQINLLLKALETTDAWHLQQTLNSLETGYLKLGQISLAAGLRAARQTLLTHLQHHNQQAV